MITTRQLDQTRSAWLSRRAEDSRRRLWLTSLLVMSVVVVDVTGYFLGNAGGRYMLVALAIFLVAVARPPLNRLTLRPLEVSDWLVLALFAYGMVGSVYGAAFTDARSPALALFFPMLLALLHLTTLGPVDEDEARGYLRLLSVVAAIYVGIHAASAMGWVEMLGGGGANPAEDVAGAVFGHEKAFLLCIALTAAWIRGRHLLFVVLLALSVVTFFAYPAATYAVAGAVSLMTLVGTGPRARRPRRYAMLFLGLFLLGSIALEVAKAGPSTRGRGASSISTSYFDAVGKSNNNETRAELWTTAWDELWDSPVYGSAFTGNTAVNAKLAGKQYDVPPHNDFLQMGMGGGFIGMGLLVGWVVTANATAVGRCKRLRAAGDVRAAALMRVLLVGFNSFFTVAFLNPVMSRFGLSVTAMLLYSMMMTIGAPAVVSRSDRGGVDQAVSLRRSASA